MQSRKRSKQGSKEKHGLAVPIALLALLVIGVLVTGAFYVLSHEPDDGDADNVSVGQVAAPEADIAVEQPQDSIAMDSLTALPDTSASGTSTGSEPLSANPVNSLPVRRRATSGGISMPANGDPERAGTSLPGKPHGP